VALPIYHQFWICYIAGMSYNQMVIISILVMGLIALIAIGSALRKFSRSLGQLKSRREEMKKHYPKTHQER
jgi:hypothetical protein